VAIWAPVVGVLGEPNWTKTERVSVSLSGVTSAICVATSAPGLAPVDWLSPPPPQAETIKTVKKLAKLTKPNLKERATCFKSKDIKKPLVQIKQVCKFINK
jgi:hypothetical protein